jgi:hypothetical protein
LEAWPLPKAVSLAQKQTPINTFFSASFILDLYAKCSAILGAIVLAASLTSSDQLARVPAGRRDKYVPSQVISRFLLLQSLISIFPV